MKSKKLALPIALLMVMMLIPLVKAQFDTFLISDILKSEFFHFVLVFLFFFGICYFALKKIIFGEEPAIASVVSIVISFFITTSFFEHFEDFLASSKTAFYVILFGALLAAMLVIKLLTSARGFIVPLSIVYLVFFYVLRFTKLIPLKYRLPLTSGNVGHLLTIIAIFAALIFVFGIFHRWRKRKRALGREVKEEARIEEEKERARALVQAAVAQAAEARAAREAERSEKRRKRRRR